MKDSGIEWLGEVPKHWKVARIGHYTQLIRGASPRPAGDSRYFGGDFMPWITVGEVTNGDDKFVLSTENYLTKEGSEQSRIIYPETLLLSNSGATLGVPKISKITGCINDGSVAFISLSNQLERDYLFYFFKTHTETYRQEMSGYGQPNLNTDIIKSTKIPLPPISEQIQINNK
jgi:type I restriction enzyme S subunit